MPPVWNGGHPDYDTERDFVGYGEAGLNPKWPNNAKIAISFVINYEEVEFLSLIHLSQLTPIRFLKSESRITVYASSLLPPLEQENEDSWNEDTG
jgi:hypothetical protein